MADGRYSRTEAGRVYPTSGHDIMLSSLERARRMTKRSSGSPNNLGGSTVVDVDENTSSIIMRDALRKRASAGSLSVVRPQVKMFSPFWQISSLQIPTEIRQKNRWRRFYYQYDPVVGRACEMHARFPLSRFSLQVQGHDDIQEEYNELADSLELFRFILWMAQEYWVVGEAIPFGFWDPEQFAWSHFILMNPDYIQFTWDPMMKTKPEAKIAEWSDTIRTVVAKGPDDRETGEIYRKLMDPKDGCPEILDYVRENRPYPLDPLACSHLARRPNYFDIRGQSIIDRVLRILMYQDKLLEASQAIADRHVHVKEFYKLGESGAVAEEGEIEAFKEALIDSWTSPLQAIVWNHALQVQFEGAAGKILPLPAEIEWITKRLCEGLMVHLSWMSGEGPTYANATVAEDMVIGEYLTFRQEMEMWIRKSVFEPVARARHYYEPVKKEIVGHYRDRTHFARRKPILPEVNWELGVLRTDYQKLTTVISLAESEKLPWSHVYDVLGLSLDDVIDEIREERKKWADLGPGPATAMAAPGMGTPLGGAAPPVGEMPMPGAGGFGAEGEMPTGENVPASPEEATMPLPGQ